MLNVKDKLPKRLRAEVSPKLYERYRAPTRERGENLRGQLAAWLRQEGQVAAAATLYRGREDLVTSYDFPEEHGLHLRTTNPGVGLRGRAAAHRRRQAGRRARGRALPPRSCGDSATTDVV
jgi:transposase-like protein